MLFKSEILPKVEMTPEKNLWYAVIYTALSDSLYGAKGDQRRAIRWFVEKSPDFLKICDWVELNPDVVRNRALALIRKKHPKLLEKIIKQKNANYYYETDGVVRKLFTVRSISFMYGNKEIKAVQSANTFWFCLADINALCSFSNCEYARLRDVRGYVDLKNIAAQRKNTSICYFINARGVKQLAVSLKSYKLWILADWIKNEAKENIINYRNIVELCFNRNPIHAFIYDSEVYWSVTEMRKAYDFKQSVFKNELPKDKKIFLSSGTNKLMMFTTTESYIQHFAKECPTENKAALRDGLISWLKDTADHLINNKEFLR